MEKQKSSSQVNKKRMDILIRLLLVLACLIIIFIFAIKPMMSKEYYFDAGKDFVFSKLGLDSDDNSYDVVVVGDGLDGISAAIGSAQVGAKTLLVCSSKELGIQIKKTYNVDWQSDVSPEGIIVSSDIFKEIRYRAEEGFNIDKYMSSLNEMVSKYENLTILYDASLTSLNYSNEQISSIDLKINQTQKIIKSKRFIDATNDGKLLKKCNVKFASGYDDIGLKDLYPPVKLNFMVDGVDYSVLKEMLQNQQTTLNTLVKEYNTTNKDISISGISITDQGSSKVIVEAVAVDNVNLSDDNDVKKAYQLATKECIDFYNYLKLNLDQFKNASGITVAQEFIRSSAYHFNGRYSLTLTDVLIGKRFADRVSSASRPVTFTLEDNSRYLLCNPKIFYMPLRALIPEGLDNVLMTGDKVSCSSLVQNVIGSNSCISGTGYSAGIIAAYSISKDMEVTQIVEEQNLDIQSEIEKTLRKLGVYMSDTQEALTDLTDNWSFSSIEKLNNLGLLSAGITNDFKLDKAAQSQDFAYIILNGVPRVSENAYSYKFDVKIRPYIKEEPLTKELFAKILLDLDGKEIKDKNNYFEACKQDLIDQTLQSKLKNKDILQFPEVYYAAVQFIEKKTGKTIK